MDLELIEDFDLGDRFGTLHLLSGSYFHKAELSGERSTNNQVLHAFPGTFELFTFPFKIVFINSRRKIVAALSWRKPSNCKAVLRVL